LGPKIDFSPVSQTVLEDRLFGADVHKKSAARDIWATLAEVSAEVPVMTTDLFGIK
jgi:hypothetical protein